MEFSVNSSPNTTDDEKVEAGHLWEEGWFFKNLLDTKTSKPMSTVYSDISQKKKKFGKSNQLVAPGLLRAPSLPALMMGEGSKQGKEPFSSKRNSGLARAPSLPPMYASEEDEDQESEFTLGRLIRQASLDCPDVSTPPRTTKATKKSYSTPRQWPKVIPEKEGISREVVSERRSKYNQFNQADAGEKSKSDSELETAEATKEVERFKEKCRVGSDEGKKAIRRRPSGIETRIMRSSAPTIPGWDDKRSAEDMKEQIKFWARAVASNVRQEC